MNLAASAHNGKITGNSGTEAGQKQNHQTEKIIRKNRLLNRHLSDITYNYLEKKPENNRKNFPLSWLPARRLSLPGSDRKVSIGKRGEEGLINLSKMSP
jgi:hypothetical protein